MNSRQDRCPCPVPRRRRWPAAAPAGCLVSEPARPRQAAATWLSDATPGERGVVDVDADAGDGVAAGGLHQNAGHLPVREHQVVGPAQIADQSRWPRDGVCGGETERQSEQRRLRRAPWSSRCRRPRSECHEWPWRPWPAVCSSARTTAPGSRPTAARMVESTAAVISIGAGGEFAPHAAIVEQE